MTVAKADEQSFFKYQFPIHAPQHKKKSRGLPTTHPVLPRHMHPADFIVKLVQYPGLPGFLIMGGD